MDLTHTYEEIDMGLKKANCEVVVHNDSGNKEWIVARYVECGLWYYSNFDDEQEARDVAVLVDGIVVRRVNK